MKKAIYDFYFILVIIIFFSLLFLVNTARAQESFIFSEIMYDPIGSDDGNEWIEVFNKSTSSVVIDNTWKFNNSSNHTLNFYNGLNTIDPNNFFVITSSITNFLNNYPNYNLPLAESSFSLNNTSGTLKLLQGTNIVSEQAYSSSIGGSSNGKTIERISLDTSDDVWRESSVLNGTPGIAPSNVSINNIPEAVISVSTSTVYVGDNISFNCLSSTDLDSDELSCAWNIGDIASSSEKDFSFQFQEPGNYNIVLQVSDGKSIDTATTTINVLENEIVSENYNGKIILNELLPNPEGDDDSEWIEIKNISNEAIDLKGFFIQDESLKKYTVAQNDFATTTINANGFFAIDYLVSRITLNNSGDKISLFDKNNNKISEILYGASKEGYAFARFADSWDWTNKSTKASENIEGDAPTNNSVVVINNTTNNVSQEDNNICDQNSVGKNIIISEIFPNPKGDDNTEFVEIYNPNDFDVNISNWKLKDKSKTFFKLQGTIKSKKYLEVAKEDSKISLNNSNEEVFLYDCKENLIANTKYDKSYEDKSYSYDNLKKEYFWTDVKTPGEENVFTETVSSTQELIDDFSQEAISTTTEISDISTTSEEVPFYSLEQNEAVSGYGVVVYPLNKILNNSAYICNYYNSENVIDYYDCLNLYYLGKWPKLTVGSIVQFSGKLSETTSSRKIKVAKKDSINLVGRVSSINPDEIILDNNINEDLFGSLVIISGKITKINKKSFMISGDEIELKVKIFDNNIDLEKFKKDDWVRVSGVILKEGGALIFGAVNKNSISKIQAPEEDVTSSESQNDNSEISLVENNKNNIFTSIFSNIGKFFQTIKKDFINKIPNLI